MTFSLLQLATLFDTTLGQETEDEILLTPEFTTQIFSILLYKSRTIRRFYTKQSNDDIKTEQKNQSEIQATTTSTQPQPQQATAPQLSTQDTLQLSTTNYFQTGTIPKNPKPQRASKKEQKKAEKELFEAFKKHVKFQLPPPSYSSCLNQPPAALTTVLPPITR